MILKLDMSSDIPIYMQVRNQIIMGIGRGELKTGDGLPTVRQMAEDIGINTVTVAKAYTILKNEGFIVIDRRHGAKVYPSFDRSSESREKLQDKLSLLIAESGLKGFTSSDFWDMCSNIFKNMCGLNLVGGER